MKRTLAFIGMLIMLLILNGCNNVKLLSQEQSLNNFAYYENQLKAVLEPSGLTMSELEIDDDEWGLYHSFLIVIDDTATITVYLSSNAEKDSAGREEVEIHYKNNDEKALDLKLFVEIVNAVSGREISESYCEQFLSAPEEDYSSSRDKLDNQKIYKYEFLNFDQDWSIGYSLYDDETEELTFWGLTKQLED